MTLNLAIITGSTRPGRKGPSVAAWAADVARAQGGFAVTELDLAAFGLPLLDEPRHPMLKEYQNETTWAWSRAIEAADAYVFVTPEYDFFAPASLVNAIQCLSQEWKYKAAGVVSYGGVSGGLRAAQVLRGLLGNVGVMAVPQTVSLPMIASLVDDAGAFAGTERMAGSLATMLGEVGKWAGALKTIRA